jgi:hypothetical protein
MKSFLPNHPLSYARTYLSFQQQTGHAGSKADGNRRTSANCYLLDALFLQLFFCSNTG